MDKKYIWKAMESVGLKRDAIKTILERNHPEGKIYRPRIESQYEMFDRFNIPLEAWRDIKSFISTSSHKQAS